MLTGVTFNRTTDNSYLSLCGSTDWDNGAAITLNGKDRTDNNGFVKIRAKDSSNVCHLILKPDGTATWGGTAISLAGHTHTKANITDFPTIPSKTSQLTNDSGFLTAHQSLSNYSTLANTVKSISISGKTITVTPGSGSAYTLTTQDTTYTHPTSSGNKHIPSGGSSGQFLGWSADGTAKWVNNPNTNTWTAMVGATSSANGSVGYVNAVPPKDGYNTKYLRADGTWQVPPDHTYTVNNATLTIQKNGTTVKTFTANASSNVTCNITVPTKVSELTNDSGFITSTVGTLEMKGNPPYIDFHGSNATRDYTSRIIDDGTADTGRLRLTAHYNSTGYQVEMYKNFFEPVVDNNIYLGDSTNRWKNIFGATGSISTSDQRVKNSIENIDDSLLDAWSNVQPKQYKFNDAIEEKGDSARYHTGYLAQDIQKACEDSKISIDRYGLFCHDSWEEQEEVAENIESEVDGKKITEKRIIQSKRDKGDLYSLRYEELLVVECAYLRREVKRLSERLEKLEK